MRQSTQGDISRKEVALLETIGNLRAWQVAVIIAVWVLGIAGAFGVYQFTTRTDEASGEVLGEDQQLYSVATGDLVNEVSVSGGLVFPNREALDFGIQGTVGRVLVSEGDFVTEGQTLAALDEESMANLEKDIAQAELDLRDAGEALDKALAPYTALDLARAEADVANADADLKAKGDDLAAMLTPSEHAVAQAEAKVASAKVAVSAAEAALESVKEPPSNHEFVSARTRITNARAQVAEAAEALRLLKEGPGEEALEEARLKIDSAQVSLRIAKLDLFLLSDDWDGKLGEERDMLEAARDAYAAVFIRWLRIELTGAERDTEPDALLESWNADLSTLFIREDSLHGVQVPPDDPATRWNDPHVYVWTHFYPGRVFGTCESAASVVGPCVKAEMDEAWAVIGPLEDSIRKLTIQEDKAVTTSQLAVTRAEGNLDQTKKELVDLLADPDRIDVEVSQASLNLAISVLQEAEDDLVVLTAGPDPNEIEDREVRIVQAEVDLQQAEADLVDLTASPDEIDVRAAEKRIVLAEATLTDAQENLAKVLTGAGPYLVALREAEITASSAVLESARAALERATITAPWTGVISKIDVEPGEQIAADSLVFEIVDESVVEVQGMVDEIDVLFVQEGQPVSVTMDALPGRTLSGVVSDIAAVADGEGGLITGERVTAAGVVRYDIRIRVETPPGLSLPEGLSALASVVIREDRGVLLVPLDALYGSFDQPLLRVMNNGVEEERPVTLGNSDDFWVVVESGVSEGDVIIMEYRDPSEGFGGPGGLFRGFGAGRFGGGAANR